MNSQFSIIGQKLKLIRQWKDLSQGKMLLTVMPEETENNRARVSQWERGTRKPPIDAQVRYAQIAGITLDQLLIGDYLLPANIRGRDLPGMSAQVCLDPRTTALRSANKDRPFGAPENETLTTRIPPKNSDGKGAKTVNKKASSEPPQDKGYGGNHASDTAEKSNHCQTAISPGKDHFSSETSDEGVTARTLKLVLSDKLNNGQFDNLNCRIPAESLERLDQLHLELLGRLPAKLRPLLSIESLVIYAVQSLLTDQESSGDKSLLDREIKTFALFRFE